LIFSLAVLIGGLAGFALEKQQLAHAFTGVDAAVGAAGVAELKG
jgi:hypothetical protein